MVYNIIMKNTTKIIEQKLAILGRSVPKCEDTIEIKNKESRKQWWSRMMETAEKDGDRLKASELLGRSEADFIDTTRHTGPDGGPVIIQPMSIKSLQDAIDRAQIQQRLCKSSS